MLGFEVRSLFDHYDCISSICRWYGNASSGELGRSFSFVMNFATPRNSNKLVGLPYPLSDITLELMQREESFGSRLRERIQISLDQRYSWLPGLGLQKIFDRK